MYDFLLSDESNQSYIKNGPGPSKPYKGVTLSGCFLSTVQKTWNKACTSVIKHASHGSGGWIKASCSESMRFCKKNIHISNLNTFLSLHLTVKGGSRSGGWRRTLALRDSCRTQKKNKTKIERIRSTKQGFVKKNVRGFWYKPRGDWFSFDKVWKLCFLCYCKQTRETSISHSHAWRIRPTSSAGTASTYDSQQKLEIKCYYFWNMDIYLTKMHGFVTGGLYSPPGAVWGTFYYECVHYVTSSELLTKAPAYPHHKARKSQDNF